MIRSAVPIITVDILGSVCMVVLAVMTFYKARMLKAKAPDNTVFHYLLWISTGFALFAVSRSFGHILSHFLILTGNNEHWQAISAYSGSINTISFMLIGLITLFFNQTWNINEKIREGKKELEQTHIDLIDLNQTLEQKVIERTERLTSSEHKTRRIFEHSLDTIIVTDDKFKIMEINPAGIELTGIDKNDMLQQEMTLDRLFSMPQEWEKMAGILQSQEYVLNEEFAFSKKGGGPVMVLITGGVDYGAFGCARTFHFIIKNINEKRLMEKQMARTDKLAALGELSAGVAHEINNPLGIILGYTQLLLKQNPDCADDLKTIEKHVKNCKSVVSDLLSFSRKGPGKFDKVDINHLVEAVVRFLSNHSDFRNIEITLNPHSGNCLYIQGNEPELSQVLINLLINACHAVDGKGRIEVSTRKTADDTVQVQVADNGRGIEKENLSRIFDPFFTTKPVGQGTGLGLSVGYGIIRRHRGDILVTSTEGSGSVFTVVLPCHPETPALTGKEQP